ncbi:MAG: hypothetical protein M1839_003300 [Geoglossum umbratile]|nr:MAG: hypothetical protein M1839_003300 [Geoglossum umbratile]
MLNRSGYSCIPDDWAPYFCGTDLATHLSVPFWNTSSSGAEYRFVSSTLATQTRVLAWAVVVKYRSEDVSLFPGNVATTLVGSPTKAPTVTTTTPATASATTSPPRATGKGAVSPGTKVAIEVPIGILSLVAVIATIYFLYRRRHRPTNIAAVVPPAII